MSFLRTLGAIGGGVAGFFIGGPVGAVAGGAMGYGLGALTEGAGKVAGKILGTPEGKGAAIGAVAGGLVLGPLGALGGAAVGALIGNVTKEKPATYPPQQTGYNQYPYGGGQAGMYGQNVGGFIGQPPMVINNYYGVPPQQQGQNGQTINNYYLYPPTRY